MRGEISIRRCSITCSWPAVVSPSGEHGRRLFPSGPGWRVRRRIVAQGCCCLSEDAPGVDWVRFWRGVGDIQELHAELFLPGDERAGVADRGREYLKEKPRMNANERELLLKGNYSGT